MPIKSIKKIKNLESKRVLVRVDFNVPIKKNKILDESRLYASLPTIKYLIEKKAKIILVTHIGRPEGKIDSSLSVLPIAKKLSLLLGQKVKFFPKLSFVGIKKYIDKQMKSGEVIMLQNIRFDAREEENNPEFARVLAGLADIFVLDGFAVAHRRSASVTGVAGFIPSYAGLLLEREVKGLDRVIKNPKKPFVAIIGGVKAETKIPIIKNLLKKADYILIGGGVVNTYLKSIGYDVQKSFTDDDLLDITKKLCGNKKVIKPVDVVVGTRDGKNWRVVEIDSESKVLCNQNESIFDIGPATINLYREYINKAKTIVWNGAMGYFEVEPYNIGSFALANDIARRSKRAYTVIGGGETGLIVNEVGKDDIDLISTGGGAMLEYLSGVDLPGIKVLD